ncbi:MAG: T9SS type A sorting domain-containing protein, partial [Sphingobacteriales bacterium]
LRHSLYLSDRCDQFLVNSKDDSSTQLIIRLYQYQNTLLNKAYTIAQFTKDNNGSWKTLGESLKEAKNNFSSSNNYKYVVLGDPALKMQMPVHNVVTDTLKMEDGSNVYASDTMKALGRYILSGSVRDQSNTVLGNFNGPVYVTIFDKTRKIQTINPEQDETPDFDQQTSIVAKVKGTVKNGRFSVTFVVPKDINYEYGAGKISYYANNETVDAAGVDMSFTVGDYNHNAAADNDAPIVKPYIDNEKFRDGGVTGPNPLLYVKLFDENGINVSGSSIGHDLVAILDDDQQNPYVMNSYYETEQNDFRQGYVNFPMYNLPDGTHTLRVKAWDAYNNSGEGVVTFEVKNKDKGFISDLYNYPNPVHDMTHIVFQHNQEGESMNVTVQLYSAAGQLVRTIKQDMTTSGNRSEILWDGMGENGAQLSRGVYFYRLTAKTSKGISATAYQKLVLLR